MKEIEGLMNYLGLLIVNSPYRATMIEVREVIGAESSFVKEMSLSSILSKYRYLELWVRDSVCQCAFSDGMADGCEVQMYDTALLLLGGAEIFLLYHIPPGVWKRTSGKLYIAS